MAMELIAERSKKKRNQLATSDDDDADAQDIKEKIRVDIVEEGVAS